MVAFVSVIASSPALSSIPPASAVAAPEPEPPAIATFSLAVRPEIDPAGPLEKTCIAPSSADPPPAPAPAIASAVFARSSTSLICSWAPVPDGTALMAPAAAAPPAAPLPPCALATLPAKVTRWRLIPFESTAPPVACPPGSPASPAALASLPSSVTFASASGPDA